jgi:hypothetical protein
LPSPSSAPATPGSAATTTTAAQDPTGSPAAPAGAPASATPPTTETESHSSPTPANLEAPSAAPHSPAAHPNSSPASPKTQARVGTLSPPARDEAPGDEPPLLALFDIAFLVQTVWNTDPAYDFFAERDTLLMGGIVLGVDALHFGPSTPLNIEFSVAHGETDSVGPLPAYISEARLRRTDLGLGLGLRHHIWSWLAPHARLAGALTFEKATVRGRDFGSFSTEEMAPAIFLGGGLTLLSPAKRISPTRSYLNSLALKVIVEGGYQWAPSLNFAVPERGASEETNQNIRTPETPLGDLSQRGAYFRVVAGAHF